MDVEVENLVSVCVSLDPTQKKKYGNQGVSKKKMRDVGAFVWDPILVGGFNPSEQY